MPFPSKNLIVTHYSNISSYNVIKRSFITVQRSITYSKFYYKHNYDSRGCFRNSSLQWSHSSRQIHITKPTLTNPSKPKLNNATLLHSSWIRSIPNLLTISRIACTPFIGNYLLMRNTTPAFLLFLYCCITDFIDGYLARKFNLKSVAGTVLDPMADKILMIVTTLSLTVAPGPQIIPFSIAAVILGRDLMLGVSALIIRFTSMRIKYKSFTWGNYWNFFKYPSVEVQPTTISKWNTFFQMIYLSCGVLLLIVEDKMSENEDETKESKRGIIKDGFKYMGYTVGITTVLSGTSYIFSKSAVRIIK
ncbi:hypothetical protein TPHA_0A03050 [Tetrapisispora phaffii CBS 4417]|uniref:CDP-diacylglycerol--glycerol-3-phosphate 3-phosphatidyltransferase n=1 Tax=Tetrapisispora phaffii (strain ATCC 24235 / CBS 4417 / NBRC 1672 / NRRL Y-8282 / UCD 70-5) TaxID=1071381 RepID=G8BNA5_TETPH|nr:hypothetical protein TPHA_0A03050 [Tetrapisispora phaffii CBS 4417]CCE61383.1 hypothetical protein TPHA_0A03050 [Tetrapisispora phaffii CBS 4417]